MGAPHMLTGAYTSDAPAEVGAGRHRRRLTLGATFRASKKTAPQFNSPSMSSETVVCERCGVFLANVAEMRLVDAKPYCATCAVRPDVDYLEAFRQKYWGRRDLWTWLVAIGLPGPVINLVDSLASGTWVGIPGQLTSLVMGIAFVMGRRWARWGMLVSVGLNLMGPTVFQAMSHPDSGSPRYQPIEWLVALSLVSMLIWIAIIQSTLNKLFFKIEVSRGELKKAWNLIANNSLARAGFLLGLLSLVAWPLGVVSLPLSLVGLSRVDPNARPPIGRKRQAIIGTVCSVVALLILAAMMVNARRN